jgi:NAD(P)-dependent dehydrogenase (short-subunit alcohol dehydrogenase family)
MSVNEICKRFVGKTILITGGAGNIGLQTAHRFAKEGAAVALLDINRDKLEIALKELFKYNVSTLSVICDVVNMSSVVQAVKQVIEKLGAIDMLFNNAGYQGEFQPVQSYPENDFKRVLDINLIGAFHVLKTVALHMVKRHTGAIVNTASMAGVDGPPNMVAYGASKFALIGMTQTAAKDLAPYNIRVNSISPGYIGPGYMWERQVKLQAKADTQYFDNDINKTAAQMISQIPMRRYGAIDEIPGIVAFLMSNDSSYITGINIPIAGGI